MDGDRDRYLLQAEVLEVLNPGGGEIFSTGQNRHRTPSSLLYNGNRSPLTAVNSRGGAVTTHPIEQHRSQRKS